MRLTLAALAAGGLTLPAVAQGAAQKSTNPSKAHRSARHSGSSSSTKTSSSKGIASTSTRSAAAHGSASKTSSAKKSAGHKAKGTRRVKGQAAPAPERVNEIQEALARNGAYSGTPNGKWDDSTVDAMRKFQSSHRLNPTGKMDAPTLQKLGLGSEIAGAAAPTPPPNTANRLLSSSNHRD